MQARGALMVEHRLIERMIGLMGAGAKQLAAKQGIDPFFIDAIVDFIVVYADRTHHGKEEAILFSFLEGRELSQEHREMMETLKKEHEEARHLNIKLSVLNEGYKNGDDSTLDEMGTILSTLADFYPRHVEKEDKIFFPAARSYMTDAEDAQMLADFHDFDRKIIHEKYHAVVDGLEKQL